MNAIYIIAVVVILWAVYMSGYYRAKHKYQPDEERRVQKFGKLRKQVEKKYENERLDEEEFLREIYGK